MTISPVVVVALIVVYALFANRFGFTLTHPDAASVTTPSDGVCPLIVTVGAFPSPANANINVFPPSPYHGFNPSTVADCTAKSSVSPGIPSHSFDWNVRPEISVFSPGFCVCAGVVSSGFVCGCVASGVVCSAVVATVPFLISTLPK